MCQRRQNSVMLHEMYGMSKFSRSRKPSMRAMPIAMSEYPEKSK